jgi:flagellar protein FliS
MLAPYTQYQNTQINTASPEKILIMLYEGAIRFSKIALEKMEKKDIAGKGKFIGKAMAIVTELMNTLNHEVGGEIAQRLEQLYVYLIGELSHANIQSDPKSLENVIAILSHLRDTWSEAVRIVQKERSAGNVQQEVRLAG